jgi:hypothetical protein
MNWCLADPIKKTKGWAHPIKKQLEQVIRCSKKNICLSVRLSVRVKQFPRGSSRRKKAKIDRYTRCAWAGGTFYFKLCRCVSFWLWPEMFFGFTSVP